MSSPERKIYEINKGTIFFNDVSSNRVGGGEGFVLERRVHKHVFVICAYYLFQGRPDVLFSGWADIVCEKQSLLGRTPFQQSESPHRQPQHTWPETSNVWINIGAWRNL